MEEQRMSAAPKTSEPSEILKAPRDTKNVFKALSSQKPTAKSKWEDM
jgi:hypothetical protein